MQHIAILTGGETDERVVSLRSSQAVDDALSSQGYDVTLYLVPEEMKRFVMEGDKYDFVRVMIHGRGGEDGQVVGLLDMMDIPYQCTSRDVMALTIDKRLTKQVWKQAGLPVARDVILTRDMDENSLRDVLSGFDFDCVCKAFDQGSSQGVVIVSSDSQSDDVMVLVQQYGRVMCEEYIHGSECAVALIDRQVLPVVEIVPPAGCRFDFENKYNRQTAEICPARYDDALICEVQQLALAAYDAVGCTRYARVDMMIGSQGPVLLEINTIPGFTDQSLFPLAAKTAGMDFVDLCENLILRV